MVSRQRPFQHSNDDTDPVKKTVTYRVPPVVDIDPMEQDQDERREMASYFLHHNHSDRVTYSLDKD